MAEECETASVEIISAEERAELERRWSNDELHHRREQVLAFVRAQRAEILQLANGSRELVDLTAAARRLIARLRSVHRPSEMRDQVREMHNEIWYCGQRGEYDQPRIKQKWTDLHAASWRDWRIKEYLFLAERSAADIADIINSHGPD
ncbi:MAG TPA: hypothetical protein VNT99_16385 [Methylomirabilota bacterium]|nr:hypothetical protein [Methylomirabilota bacterium]